MIRSVSGAGWLAGLAGLEAEMGAGSGIPCKVQLNANVSRGRKGVDIVDFDVRAFSF